MAALAGPLISLQRFDMTRLTALKTATALALATIAAAAPASASTLPSPYVSRALDAVLIPVTADTIAAFGLGGDETGVLVLSVEPGGVADASGIVPGDIISTVQGKAVADPILLDEIVYYWISQGMFDFGFDGWRDGSTASYAAVVTQEEWLSLVDVTTISTWSSYSSESYSYEAYYAEYSEEIASSYESSESMIETTAESEDFAGEADAAADAEVMDDSGADDAPADDTAVDDGTDGDGGDDPGMDDGAADDGGDDSDMDAGGGDDTTGDEE